MAEQFIQELTRVGGTVYRTEDREDIYLYLVKFAEEKGVKFIARGKLPDFNEKRIDRIFKHHLIDVIPAGARVSASSQEIADKDRKRFREGVIAAQMGINTADCGIAETGTLAFFTMEGQSRLISALPPIHVAMMRMGRLVANWDELTPILKDYLIPPNPPLLKGGRGDFQRGTGVARKSCITFITGPSRTADIELSLTIGVHGPKQLHVILYP